MRRAKKMTKKILVIEDNEKSLLLLKDVLTYHKYEIVEAESGEEGIEKARKEAPDLILLDIQLPGISGYEVVNILKGAPETAGIKIIGITSYAMKGDRERVLKAGFDGYVEKPIDTRRLPEIIKEFLD